MQKKIFTKRNTQMHFSYVIGTGILASRETVRDLDVLYDLKLTFDVYIDYNYNK